MKVYIATHGVSSNYQIYGVFSTREQAEEFLALSVADDEYEQQTAQVEEWALDVPPSEWRIWTVCMKRDGSLPFRPRGEVTTKPPEGTKFICGRDTPDRNLAIYWLACEVVAETEERAIKVTNERRTALIAAGWWPEELITQ